MTILEWLAGQTSRKTTAGQLARRIATVEPTPLHLNGRAELVQFARSSIGLLAEDAAQAWREYTGACKPTPALASAAPAPAAIQSQVKLETSRDVLSGAIKAEGLSFTAVVVGNAIAVYWRGATPPAITLKREKPNA